ncbi:MAG: hypothetical protein ABSC03_13870 [Verrucomicrobiota bacterium]
MQVPQSGLMLRLVPPSYEWLDQPLECEPDALRHLCLERSAQAQACACADGSVRRGWDALTVKGHQKELLKPWQRG